MANNSIAEKSAQIEHIYQDFLQKIRGLKRSQSFALQGFLEKIESKKINLLQKELLKKND